MAINKELKNITIKEISKEMMEARVIYNNKRWRIITLYSQNIKKIMELVKKKSKKRKNNI